MWEDIEQKKKRHDELQHLLADPKIISDSALYQRYAKELASLSKIINLYEEHKKLQNEIGQLEVMISHKDTEKEFLELANEELAGLKRKLSELQRKIEDTLIEQVDALKDKNIIMEIRAGTGGLEASLFAADLFRMYSKYASKKGWKLEIINSNSTEKGGYKEIIFSISGKGVYDWLRFESGTHRVQRVPVTETSGRIHTSAATVAVLPEADEVEVKIRPEDLRIDTFRAGGHGGQHLNVTDSAVRVTHLPTGLVVTCQDERSQHKNKSKALRVLRARLFDLYTRHQQEKISQDRKRQVGSGDRSEKIRTYNFSEKRVTDHRVGLTLHKLEEILEGELDEIILALKEKDRKIKLGLIF